MLIVGSILTIQYDQVVEKRTPDESIRSGGPYADLYRRQFREPVVTSLEGPS